MQRLRWFLIGIAVTAFSADYVRMKAGWKEMETVATISIAAATRAQASSTDCLVELAYNRSIIESWTEKRRLITLAQVEVLQLVGRAKEGDAEAIASLNDLGFSISRPSNRLVASLPPVRGRGIGGF